MPELILVNDDVYVEVKIKEKKDDKKKPDMVIVRLLKQRITMMKEWKKAVAFMKCMKGKEWTFENMEQCRKKPLVITLPPQTDHAVLDDEFERLIELIPDEARGVVTAELVKASQKRFEELERELDGLASEFRSQAAE